VAISLCWEFWIGPDERLLYTSPSCESITGHPAAAFEQDITLLRRIIHSEDRAAYDNHRHRVKGEEKAEELEFRIIRPDGTLRWIAHVCQPVYDDEGRFNGTRGSNRDITMRKLSDQERERLIIELQEALAQVKTLSGMLPICASCKKIRDDQGYWKQIEAYISEHSEAEFSHGICPDCADKIYGKYYKKES
jgi:PAS domain S-box-containing protein